MGKGRTKKIRITFDVDPEVNKAIVELAEKERWSKRRVAIVAMEYYLKLRGCWPEVKNG